MEDEVKKLLPLKPERPRDEECCGSGCTLCVFDIYERQLRAWEEACRTQTSISANNVGHNVLSQSEYSPFQLVDVTPHSDNANIYRFQAAFPGTFDEIEGSLTVGIGQYLIMKHKSSDKGTSLMRAYTPISSSVEHARGCFDVVIKLYPGGKMSKYISQLKKGDIVLWSGPFGDFSYSRNKFKHVLMLCAGTGIAPMLRIVQSIVEDDDEETFVHLLFTCRKYSEVLLSKQIHHFKSYWNFTQSTFITREHPSDTMYGEHVIGGKISEEKMQEELSGKPAHEVLVLICGTKSFNKDMMNFVLKAGVLLEHIHIF